MARPTKLTKELVAKADKYLDECKMGGLYFGELPQIAGLAIYLNVSRESVYEWSRSDTPLGREFSDIFERVMAEQERKLIGKSLKNEYNSTITKLMLTKHGYVEKQATDLTTNGKELPTPILGGLAQATRDGDAIPGDNGN